MPDRDSEILRQYENGVSLVRHPADDEELRLIRSRQSEEEQWHLIEAHAPIALKLAKRHRGSLTRLRALEIANEALAEAILTFDEHIDADQVERLHAYIAFTVQRRLQEFNVQRPCE